MPLVGKCAEFRRDGVANGAPQRAVEGCCVPDGLRKDSGAVGGTVDTVAAADTMEPLGPCGSTESRIRATSLALALLAASWAGGCRVGGWLPDWLGGSLAGCHAHHSKEPIPRLGTPSEVVESSPIFTVALGMRDTRSVARSRNPSDVLQKGGGWVCCGHSFTGGLSHWPGLGSFTHHTWPGCAGHGRGVEALHASVPPGRGHALSPAAALAARIAPTSIRIIVRAPISPLFATLPKDDYKFAPAGAIVNIARPPEDGG